MSIATIGARYQVVIPAKVRKRIGLKPNQKINVSVEDDRIILEPIGYRRIRGITREVRDGVEATDYIRKLRSEWENRK